MYAVVFFFQAEDGIRDGRVTGVQTCALPIWGRARGRQRRARVRRRISRRTESMAAIAIRRWRSESTCSTESRAEIGRASCRERVEISVGGGTVKNKRTVSETDDVYLVTPMRV